MRKFIYQLHLWLGILVSIPVLAWALSGFLYALPNTVEGGTIEKIDASRVKIAPAEAMEKANDLAGENFADDRSDACDERRKTRLSINRRTRRGFDFYRCGNGRSENERAARLENTIFPRGAFLFLRRKLAGDAFDYFFASGVAFGDDGNLSELRLLVRRKKKSPQINAD